MLWVLATVSIPGALILVWVELFGTGLLTHVWPLVLGAGCFQGIYFFGLTMGYRSGDLSVVYPVTRALPVLFIGIFDLAQRQSPSTLGWAGLLLVTLGCIAISYPGRREGYVEPERRRVSFWLDSKVGWAILAAAGTVGYPIFDKTAAEVLLRENVGGLLPALHYGLWELVISTVIFAGIVQVATLIRDHRRHVGVDSLRTEAQKKDGRGAFLERGLFRNISPIGIGVLGTYSLVLWAYQLSERASYVVALRQFSIVIGTLAGVILMRERAPVVRVIWAVVITAGVFLVSMAP